MSRHRLPDAADHTAQPTPSTVSIPLPREAPDSRPDRTPSSTETGPAHEAPAHEAPAHPAPDRATPSGPAGHRAAGAHSRRARPVAAPDTGRPAADAPAAVEAPTEQVRPDRRHAAPAERRRHGLDRTRPAERPRRGRPILNRIGGSRRTAAVLLAVAVGIVALPTTGSAAVDQCRWQVAAHDLLVSLDGRSDDRSDQLRKALKNAGVSEQLPEGCAKSAADSADGTDTADGTSSSDSSDAADVSADAPTATAPTRKAAVPKAAPAGVTAPSAAKKAAPVAAASTGTGTTAAQQLGWGAPVKSDDFSAGLDQWGLYDGSGHDGNGRRTPDAVAVANGVMTMTGGANGDTGGMAWGKGQKYGRWEARVRTPAGDDNYHPVLLLWPDAENWPVGGEIDWMEISDPARQTADTFLHYGSQNDQVQGDVKVDGTQWHNWAVEWTPQGVTTFLDGKEWWKTTDSSILPPGPMHMTIQLDNFGGGGMKESQMQVDWVKQYGL